MLYRFYCALCQTVASFLDYKPTGTNSNLNLKDTYHTLDLTVMMVEFIYYILE